MNPFPNNHSVLIMDNCKIHHTDTLQDVLNDAGLYSIMFDRVNMHSIIHPQVSCYFISCHTHLTSTWLRSHLVCVCNTVLLQIFWTILTKLSGKAYLQHHGGMIQSLSCWKHVAVLWLRWLKGGFIMPDMLLLRDRTTTLTARTLFFIAISVNLRPTIKGARGPMAQGRRLSEQERSARNPTLC